MNKLPVSDDLLALAAGLIWSLTISFNGFKLWTARSIIQASSRAYGRGTVATESQSSQPLGEDVFGEIYRRQAAPSSGTAPGLKALLCPISADKGPGSTASGPPNSSPLNYAGQPLRHEQVTLPSEQTSAFESNVDATQAADRDSSHAPAEANSAELTSVSTRHSIDAEASVTITSTTGTGAASDKWAPCNEPTDAMAVAPAAGVIDLVRNQVFCEATDCTGDGTSSHNSALQMNGLQSRQQQQLQAAPFEGTGPPSAGVCSCATPSPANASEVHAAPSSGSSCSHAGSSDASGSPALRPRGALSSSDPGAGGALTPVALLVVAAAAVQRRSLGGAVAAQSPPPVLGFDTCRVRCNASYVSGLEGDEGGVEGSEEDDDVVDSDGDEESHGGSGVPAGGLLALGGGGSGGGCRRGRSQSVCEGVYELRRLLLPAAPQSTVRAASEPGPSTAAEAAPAPGPEVARQGATDNVGSGGSYGESSGAALEREWWGECGSGVTGNGSSTRSRNDGDDDSSERSASTLNDPFAGCDCGDCGGPVGGASCAEHHGVTGSLCPESSVVEGVSLVRIASSAVPATPNQPQSHLQPPLSSPCGVAALEEFAASSGPAAAAVAAAYLAVSSPLPSGLSATRQPCATAVGGQPLPEAACSSSGSGPACPLSSSPRPCRRSILPPSATTPSGPTRRSLVTPRPLSSIPSPPALSAASPATPHPASPAFGLSSSSTTCTSLPTSTAHSPLPEPPALAPCDTPRSLPAARPVLPADHSGTPFSHMRLPTTPLGLAHSKRRYTTDIDVSPISSAAPTPRSSVCTTVALRGGGGGGGRSRGLSGLCRQSVPSCPSSHVRQSHPFLDPQPPFTTLKASAAAVRPVTLAAAAASASLELHRRRRVREQLALHASASYGGLDCPSYLRPTLSSAAKSLTLAAVAAAHRSGPALLAQRVAETSCQQ